MENHGDPRDREGESGAEHEEYEFLQETLKDEKKRGRIGKSTIISVQLWDWYLVWRPVLVFLR